MNPAALVLTQVAQAEPLAAACALAGVEVDAVATEVGALAVCRSTGPGEPERVAEAVSRLLRNTPVVLLVQREGQITATRWAQGAPGETVPAGLVLDGAPDVVEELLLAQVTGVDVPGAVASTGMSRWRAGRVLAAAGRAGRRAARR